MTERGQQLVIFEILVPRTDGHTGVVHPTEELDQWVLETAARYGGITVLGLGIFGLWYEGAAPIEDHSNWYKIGVKPEDVEALREHARKTAERFGQACLYLERAGEAELVPPLK